jgi:predicted nucleotidyltransferase component of viral defense system
MAIADGYRKQVALLIRTIPFVATEKEFALKGGTAINLFVRDMPRLSVDIDLTYVPVADRATSLKAIDAGMKRIADAITKGMRGAQLNASQPKGETCTTKLILRAEDAQIKIEVTPVLRGCVYEPVVKRVSPKVEEEFGFAEMPVVHFADLFAGKIMAALDRQHPRDLFDVRDLLANARPSSFTCSAITGRWPKFSRRRGSTSRPNTSAASRAWWSSRSASMTF